MNFNSNKAIYLQIVDSIIEDILMERLKPGSKIPSVRETAATNEVNPNTVMRTYTILQNNDIIFTKRGMGYFVTDDAQKKCIDIKKDEFEQEELPTLFRAMHLLNIDMKDLETKYTLWKNTQSVNK